MAEVRTQYKDQYNKLNYEHWNLYLLPGLKDLVSECAKNNGSTLTGYVRLALEAQLLRDGVPSEELRKLEEQAKEAKELHKTQKPQKH